MWFDASVEGGDSGSLIRGASSRISARERAKFVAIHATSPAASRMRHLAKDYISPSCLVSMVMMYAARGAKRWLIEVREPGPPPSEHDCEGAA